MGIPLQAFPPTGANMTGVLERFTHVEPRDLDLWCRIHLGAGLQVELFRDGHLSRVIGVRLTSGQHVVVKVRQRSSRLVACSTAHRVLFERGFPCPEPLVDLEPLGEGVASAEAMIVGGEVFPDSGRCPDPFAKALAHLIAMAPTAEELGSLEPAPPWTAPTNEVSDLWPWPDDLEVDLNTVDGPAWIEQGARVARDRLQSCGQQVTIGHGDWYTANLRWADRSLLAVFDWDSVIAAPEPVIVGLAAAVYATTEVGTEANIDETERFLDAYSSARSRAFSSAELEEAWAAGLWNRCFDAKKQFVTAGRVFSLSERESLERQRRAGFNRTQSG